MTTRPRLSIKTSEFGRKAVVRKYVDVNKRETSCTPFLEVADVQRNDDRCHISLRTTPGSPFHEYLLSINAQLRAFLCPINNLRMPYDEALHLLRVKVPVCGGRLAVRVHDSQTLDEIPASSISAGSIAAVQMTLNDVWLDADVVMPTWVAEKVLLRPRTDEELSAEETRPARS